MLLFKLRMCIWSLALHLALTEFPMRMTDVSSADEAWRELRQVAAENQTP